MFSEPTINSVNNLFNAPGLGLELAGAIVLAFGVACYLARVVWFSLSHARQMEMEAMQSVALSTPHDSVHAMPYGAG